MALQGLRFALIRPEIRAITPPSQPSGKLLVSFGGTDPYGLSQKTFEFLTRHPIKGMHVTMVAAALPAMQEGHLKVLPPTVHMASLLEDCDAILCTPSTIALEAASCGRPIFHVQVADNQSGIAVALAQSGSGIPCGDAATYDPAETMRQITAVLADEGKFRKRSEFAMHLVDGLGAERVVNALCACQFSFRHAASQDARTLWEWTNDPVTRSASFNSDPIPWEEHCAWFAQKLASSDSTFLIVQTIDAVSFAALRFDKSQDGLAISFSIAPPYRGLGLAPSLLREGCSRVAADAPRIHAYIRPENRASISAFERAGFKLRHEENSRLHYCLET